MNHFPFFSQLDAGILNAIQNLDKTKFTGAMPYVYFAHYLGDGQVIGQTINWDYKSGGERFPPVITNLEVKPNGSMGVVRHGVVTVKFASMNQLNQYQNFFRIGNAKSIVWGWNKNRKTGDTQQPASATASKDIAGNINAWLSFCAGTSHTSDAMVGPLIDFSFTLNPDASVDATFTVGTKTEIPAYLGMNQQNVNKTPASSQNNKIDTKIARLLEPDAAKFKLALQNDIKNHLLNYEFVKSNQSNGMLAQAGNAISDAATTDYTPTERVYVDMATIIKYTVNKAKTSGDIVNISKSIAKAHPNMISTSENIVFPNSQMANPTRTGENDNASLTLSINPVQNFKVNGREFVNHSKDETFTFNGYTNTFKKSNYGNVGEIYVDVDFALDAWYNTAEGSVKDFIDKLCTEINIASAGLMELGLDESADSNTNNSVLTIVDYNLVPTGVKQPPALNLFGNDTSIINMSFNTDLPKEIISMAMLGNRKGIEIGKQGFFGYIPDFLSAEYNKTKSPPPLVAKPTAAESKGFTSTPGTIGADGQIVPFPPATEAQKKAAAELAKRGVKAGESPAPSTVSLSGAQVTGNFANDLAKQASTNNATEGLIDENCIVIGNLPKETEHTNNNKGTKVVLKDVAVVKNLYFGNTALNKNNPLLPAELELTVLGISGVTVGRIVRIAELPFQSDAIMQVVEVNHRVSDTWETVIKLKCRPAN